MMEIDRRWETEWMDVMSSGRGEEGVNSYGGLAGVGEGSVGDDFDGWGVGVGFGWEGEDAGGEGEDEGDWVGELHFGGWWLVGCLDSW